MPPTRDLPYGFPLLRSNMKINFRQINDDPVGRSEHKGVHFDEPTEIETELRPVAAVFEMDSRRNRRRIWLRRVHDRRQLLRKRTRIPQGTIFGPRARRHGGACRTQEAQEAEENDHANRAKAIASGPRL